jgi:hypothetical protein
MAPRISKGRIVTDTKYKATWAGKQANVRTSVRLNFIEAQRQILDKGRQNKAATGGIVALLMSILIWAILVRFVL